MAASNQQTAVQAAAITLPARGASGGRAAAVRALAGTFLAWLDDHDTVPDDSRAALLGAALALKGVAKGSSVTAKATELLSIMQTDLNLVSIAVTPLNPSKAHPGTQQFVATATYGDGSTAVVTDDVVWVSATPAKATIDQAGLATTVAAGTSVITAAMSGVTSPGSTLTVT